MVNLPQYTFYRTSFLTIIQINVKTLYSAPAYLSDSLETINNVDFSDVYAKVAYRNKMEPIHMVAQRVGIRATAAHVAYSTDVSSISFSPNTYKSDQWIQLV